MERDLLTALHAHARSLNNVHKVDKASLPPPNLLLTVQIHLNTDHQKFQGTQWRTNRSQSLPS